MKNILVRVSDDSQFEALSHSGTDGVIFPVYGYAFAPVSFFSRGALEAVILKAKKNNLAVYLQADRLFHEEEMQEVEAFLKWAFSSEIAGLFFADPGIMQAAEMMGKQNLLIYDPGTLMTNSCDGEWWLNQGVQGAVVSGLLSKEELLSMTRLAKKLYFNVHGYQPLAVSARALLETYTKHKGSESLQGKGGLTLQEEHRAGRMPVYESEQFTMVFQDAAQISIRETPLFTEHGMQNMILNSWFLPIESICEAVKLYKKDMICEEAAAAEENYLKQYADCFFTKGYYDEKTIQ